MVLPQRGGDWSIMQNGGGNRLPRKMEDKMENRVLAAYATKYGATAEIAANIGEVLVQG